MSYRKAMLHATNSNLNKGKRQYMGFDTSHSEPRKNIDVLRKLFHSRNGGRNFYKSKYYMRKLIRRYIAKIRKGEIYLACDMHLVKQFIKQ